MTTPAAWYRVQLEYVAGRPLEIQPVPRRSCSRSHHTSSCPHEITELSQHNDGSGVPGRHQAISSMRICRGNQGQDGLENPLFGQGACKTCLSPVSPKALRPRRDSESIKHVISITGRSLFQSSEGKVSEGLPLSEAAHLSSSQCSIPSVVCAAGNATRGPPRLQLFASCAGVACRGRSRD